MIAGIDTHKDTLAVAVIDQAGRRLAHRELPNTRPRFAELTALLDQHAVQRAGIEGSGAYGRAVAVHLALDHSPSNGEDLVIVEVPTLGVTPQVRAAVPGPVASAGESFDGFEAALVSHASPPNRPSPGLVTGARALSSTNDCGTPKRRFVGQTWATKG